MTPMRTHRLMAVLAHPDDESLGIGGTIAKYAAEGVEVFLVSATRGDGGRYRIHRPGDPQHPGADALAAIRERELCAASSVLGVKDVAFLDYRDQQLDRARPRDVIDEMQRCAITPMEVLGDQQQRSALARAIQDFAHLAQHAIWRDTGQLPPQSVSLFGCV